MKQVLLRLANRLRPLQPSRALGVITCAASANALMAIEQQVNHAVTGAISDCIGGQILQFVPLLAAMSTDGSNTGSLAAQLAAALIGAALFAIIPGLVSSMRPKPAATKAHA